MASMTGMDAGGSAQTIDVGQVKSKFQVNTAFLSYLTIKKSQNFVLFRIKNLNTISWPKSNALPFISPELDVLVPLEPSLNIIKCQKWGAKLATKR
jgi:hypothetical protein